MLTFYFTSLSFLPPLLNEKKFYFAIQLTDGITKSTEPFPYIPEANLAITHSALEFITKEPDKEPYFQIEVMEYNEKWHGKRHMIGRETISISKEIANTSHELTLPTVYGTDAVVGLTLEISNSSKDLYSEDKQTHLNYKEDLFEHFSDKMHKFDKYNPFKLAPLYNKFVIGLSPLVIAEEMLIDLVMWKEPLKTFWYSILITFSFLFGRFLMGAGFIYFFIFSRRIISQLISVQPVENKVKEKKRDIYKRNFAFMTKTCHQFVQVYEFCNELFGDPNKSLLFRLLFILRRFSPVLAFFCFTIRFRYLVIFAYWTLLSYNTKIGKDVLIQTYYKATTIMDYLHYKALPMIIYFRKIEDLIYGKDNKAKIAKGYELLEVSTEASRQSLGDLGDVSTPPKSTSLSKLADRVFVTYENQRWWPHKGWDPVLLPGERPSWSNDTGEVELSRQSFKLPRIDWYWETEWNIIITSNTDKDGWDYASRFKKFEEPNRRESLINTVRRRKWMRKCVGPDD